MVIARRFQETYSLSVILRISLAKNPKAKGVMFIGKNPAVKLCVTCLEEV